ncbi:MAG: rhodanese-like domain-containing protein [Proteobacteria bacterium]|nr:rhodanese-like domain-containing protein [Pseudomonadota bacterium]
MTSELHNFRKIANIVINIAILFFFLSCTATPPRTSEQKYINPEKVISLIKEKKAVVVDTMSYLECMDHRIPGSLCIALEEFENKSPALLKDKKQTTIFYCESEECPRAGLTYEKAKTAGYEDIYILEGGLSAWKRTGYEVETVERIKRAPVVSIKPRVLKALAMEKKGLFVLDIRSEDAFKAGHIDGAINIPLYTLHKKLKEIPKNRPVIVVDESGKRSFLACCYLINNGFKDVVRLYGGMKHEEPRKGKKG